MTVTRTWIWGRDSYNQKIQTGPTGQSGPPFEVDQSFCETFPVGPNRSVVNQALIGGNQSERSIFGINQSASSIYPT